MDTLPSTILPNGETAEVTAHKHVLKGNKRRNSQKRKLEENVCLSPTTHVSNKPRTC